MHHLLRPALRWGVIALLLVATGCLPHGCRRSLSDAVTPTDSLSRTVAASVPMDTLRAQWHVDAVDDQRLGFPRTVRFRPDGAVVLSDAERNALYTFSAGGTLQQRVHSAALDIPYLAGRRGDTLVVYSAGARAFRYVTDGRVLPDATPLQAPTEALIYTTAADTALYAKILAEDAPDRLVRMGRNGAVRATAAIEGPHWRTAGYLLLWGDSLLSLSGFRPTVRVWPRAFARAARPDTMRLIGFDSPMLERSYNFMKGDADKPPLLVAAADAAGPYLFVLNLRPGWLRVDAYDRAGRLQHRLVEARPDDNKNFYPRDMAVRRTPTGYRFAVAFTDPVARLAVYDWALSAPAAPVPQAAAPAPAPAATEKARGSL